MLSGLGFLECWGWCGKYFDLSYDLLYWLFTFGFVGVCKWWVLFPLRFWISVLFGFWILVFFGLLRVSVFSDS